MNLPQYQPSVEPNVLPAPQRSGADPVAQAAGNLGKTAENVAGKELGYLGEVKYQADTSRVDGMHAQLMQEVNDWQQKASSERVGEKAVNLTNDGMAEYTKIKDKYSTQLTDPQQKQMFEHVTRNIPVNLDLDLQRHEYAEGKKTAVNNKKALIDSQEQALGARYLDIVPTKEGGFEFGKTFSDQLIEVQANTLAFADMQGYGEKSETAKNMVMDARSKAYQNAITQVAVGDPMKAQQLLNTYSGKMEPGAVALLSHQIGPKIAAYAVDDVLAQAEAKVPMGEPDTPYPFEAVNKEVQKSTKDPAVRKDIYAELERRKRMKDQTAKETLDFNYGKIADAWENNNNISINDVKKMPEFGKLTETQQGNVLAKIRQKIEHQQSERRTLLAAEKSATAASRSAETAERARKHELEREQQKGYDKNYNDLLENPDRVSAMSEDEVKKTRLDLGEKDYPEFLKLRQKIKTDEGKHIYQIRADAVKGVLDKAGIIDDTERADIHRAVTAFVGDEKEPAKIKAKAIEAMQHVYETRPAHLWERGDTKQTVKTPKQMKAEGAASKPSGKKLVGTKGGKNVYELPSGKWQVGD